LPILPTFHLPLDPGSVILPVGAFDGSAISSWSISIPLLKRDELVVLRGRKEEAEKDLESPHTQFRLQKKYLAHLQERLHPEDSAPSNNSEPQDASLADKIASVLRKVEEPMRGRDIACALEKIGVNTSSPNPLQSCLCSTFHSGCNTFTWI